MADRKIIVLGGGVVTTSFVAWAADTTIGSEITGARPEAEKANGNVTATSSARPANVATPPETVTAVVPWSGVGVSTAGRPRRRSRRDRDHRRVVPGLDVAVPIFLDDHWLRRERVAGRRRRRRLRLDHQLRRDRRADGDARRIGDGQPAAGGEPELDRLGLVVREARERGHALRHRRGCPDERAGTGRELGRDDRAAVAGLEVTESILLLDHRLDAQRLAGRRARRQLRSTINWLATAGLTLMLPEGPAVNPPPEKSSEIGSALS